MPDSCRPAPALSVVVPLFQSERTVGATLASLLAQDLPEIEIVVVDDGSTDAGPSIVEHAMTLDSRIRLVRQANRGLAGARNSGIAAARADVIGFCDADDVWETGKARFHLRLLSAAPSVGLSFSGSRIIAEDGKPTGLLRLAPDGSVTPEEMLLRNPVGNGSSAVVRRACLDDVAFRGPDGRRQWFDETYRQCEDIQLWMRIMLSGWDARGIAAPLVGYRISASSLSSNLARQAASWDRMLGTVRGLAPELAARSGGRARAIMLAWLARKAILALDGRQGLSYLIQALCAHPRLLAEDSARTAFGLGAGLALCLIPRAVAGRLKGAGIAAFARIKPPRKSRTALLLDTPPVTVEP